MINQTIDYLGVPLTSQKITPGSTATGISANILTPNRFTVSYTSGGTTQLVAGDVVIGASSGAVGTIVDITLTSGTWAGGDAAGVITLKDCVGTWTSAENIKVKAGTNDATLTLTPVADTSDYPYKGCGLRAITVNVTGNTALVCIDGSNPDQTYKKGFQLVANTFLTITNPDACRNFKVMDAVNASATVVVVQGYF